MSANQTNREPQVIVNKTLPATPEEVFDAWTDADEVSAWMAGVMTDPPLVRIDARDGGTFRIDMDYKGEALPHTGEYEAVERPHRLVFSWHSRFTGKGDSVVEIVLAEKGGQTDFTLTHSGLPEEWVSAHQDGWAGFADELGKYLATR